MRKYEVKDIFRIAIAFGFINWAVSIYEFVMYRKASGALVLATLLFIFGFGGLFIHNKIAGRK